jgi:type IV pilus assembly protein PilM
MKAKRLPLGLDIGASRIRIALAECSRSGDFYVSGIASRDLPDDAVTAESLPEPELIAAIIDDLRGELGTRERRCVIALPASVALLRLLRFPNMSRAELQRAACFEAERFHNWSAEEVESVVRVHPADRAQNLHVVGVARRDALMARVGCVRRAGLKVVGVDHEAFALQRAFPHSEAVLDVGHRQATLHTFGTSGLNSMYVPGGGAEVTRAIAADLSIDTAMAERRKRILGTAGAGESYRDAFATAVGTAIAKARERGALRRVIVTGNGSRLPGLAAALEHATQAPVEAPVSALLGATTYPDDVIRAAAPDWTMAVALATWGAAR